ncbi:MAG TPA: hypothetical protein VG779_02955 [Actinomycetota bacterium]|jgi:hypothetical protein|nr:hypothetical protein [Actinomycetota bacterium]
MRVIYLVNLGVQGGDGTFEVLDVVQGDPDQQGMVLVEAAL